MSAFGPGNTMAAPASESLVFGGFWIRFVAYVIDGIILGVVNGLMFSAFGSSMVDATADPQNLQYGPLMTASLLSVLIPAIYTIGFWSSSGATPGKMAMKLRVVRSDTGGPITTGQAIGRFFGYFVSSFVFALGFLWVAFDARKQGWHDKLASTVVVRRVGLEAAAFRR